MATSNFHNANASKVFVVLENYEQVILDEDGEETDETEYRTPDEWECDDFVSHAKGLIEKNKGKFDFYNGEQRSKEELRSFCATFLGQLYQRKDFGDVCVEVNINAFLRSGYYEAANLDWELVVYVDGYEFEDDIILDDIRGSWMNEGLKAIQVNHINKYISKTKDAIVEHLEHIFEQLSTPYVVTARFSNGETMYEKADSKRALLKNAVLNN